MNTSRSVLITISGIVAIGFTLAMLAPHQWETGELVLLAACIVLMRERLMVRNEKPLPHGATEPFALRSIGWFGGSAYWPREFGHWPAGSTALPKSVEQIAQEMMTHAFLQASLKYHPDNGGDPVEMQRVYEARALMARAIRRA